MNNSEKINLLIEALKVLTRDEDTRTREQVRDMLYLEFKIMD